MFAKKQLGNILVESGIITVKTLERALERQKGSGKRLGMVLEEMGVITEEELIAALAQQFGFKTVAGFAPHNFLWDTLGLVPEDLAVRKLVFPLKQKDGMLAVATTDPFDSDTFDFLAKKTGMKIVPVLATRKDITDAVSKHYLGGRPPTGGKPRILVVDDSQAIAMVIQAALVKEGYEVFVAHDGVEGLKMAIAEQPDMIICDSVMPRMDGYALKNAVHGNPATASTPIILITSKASGEDEQKALESGFLDFIPKPIQPIRVVSRVKRAFEIVKNSRK
ncbi:MAG TPA: response regulator [Geobacteraceae bacterium]